MRDRTQLSTPPPPTPTLVPVAPGLKLPLPEIEFFLAQSVGVGEESAQSELRVFTLLAQVAQAYGLEGATEALEHYGRVRTELAASAAEGGLQ